MPLLFAETSNGLLGGANLLMVAAGLLMGGACFQAAWWLHRTLRTDDLEQGDDWRYDVSRINELRRTDLLYRLFQPVIRLLSRVNRVVFRDGLPQVQQELLAAGYPRCWLPEEYLGRTQLTSLLVAPVYLYMGVRWMDASGVILAIVLTGLTAWMLRRRLASQARYRLVLIKRRMPYLLDLLTLLMEAGSTFFQAMRQAVQELQGHDVAVEFGRVLSDINLGKTRRESFEAMQERLNDPEINAIVTSIIQGEELGTPLAKVFRIQSDVLRIKRSQRAETIAGEAGVNMLLPGILIMASTVLIILGPFVLNFVYSGFGI